MVIAAVCMAADTADGSVIKMPFGYGDDHGEAGRMLAMHYGIEFPAIAGFAASVGTDIVFFTRESALRHAVPFGQVKEEFLNRTDVTRLNSEMVSSYERGNMYGQLKDVESRMEDIYSIVKYEHHVKADYDGLEPLSSADINKIKNFFKRHGRF